MLEKRKNFISNSQNTHKPPTQHMMMKLIIGILSVLLILSAVGLIKQDKQISELTTKSKNLQVTIDQNQELIVNLKKGLKSKL